MELKANSNCQWITWNENLGRNCHLALFNMVIISMSFVFQRVYSRLFVVVVVFKNELFGKMRMIFF